MLLAPFVSLLALVQIGGSVCSLLSPPGFFWFSAQPRRTLPAPPSARHGSLYGVIFFVSFGLGSVAITGGWIASAVNVTIWLCSFAAVVGDDHLAGVLALRASRH